MILVNLIALNKQVEHQVIVVARLQHFTEFKNTVHALGLPFIPIAIDVGFFWFAVWW